MPKQFRQLLSALLLLALVGTAGCTIQPIAPQPVVEESVDPQPATEQSTTESPQLVLREVVTSQMVAQRAAHTATHLPDGRVLLTGGFAEGESALASAEVFDPQARTFAAIDDMSAARQSHTATLLPDGRVLIAGGMGASGDYLASAEIYDPVAQTFTAINAMTEGRSGHRAVLLDDDTVLLVGGVGRGWTFLASAEIFDPASGQFSATGAMSTPRESHTATLLPDGRVLVVGGHQGRRTNMEIFSSAEIYEPATARFVATGALNIRRHKHDATRLGNGRVLISGGADERDSAGIYRSTEIFDPTTGTFAPAAEMNAARYKHTDTSLLLPNGRVLLAGGAPSAEVYDPVADRFHRLDGHLNSTRLFAAASVLDDGALLLAGGYGSGVSTSGTAWIFYQ